jgi:putative transposase
VLRKLKKEVADDLRSIFYASSKNKAVEFFEHFKKKWKNTISLIVSCLERSINACLTFFSFPEEEWIPLRTTNIIERLNKEFKRRTKPIEILAGETACYRLLAFISLRMELHCLPVRCTQTGRSNPIGRVYNNLPFFKELAYEKFTQKN